MESKKLFVVQKPREVENAQARVALKKGENSSKHQLDYPLPPFAQSAD